jgi:predicted AAA+ superfamily ATPase
MENLDKKQLVIDYFRSQEVKYNAKAKAYLFDQDGKRLDHRNLYVKLKMLIDKFIVNTFDDRWIIMPGLRGTGKTTLLLELYFELKSDNVNKYFFSLDQITRSLGVETKYLFQVFEEEIIGKSFEEMTTKCVFFLDEVQYDPGWATTIKTIYDRSKNVFFLCSGSSALEINTTVDTARRSRFEKLFPMSFTEFIKISKKQREIKDLSQSIRQAIFKSSNAEEVFNKLLYLRPKVLKYWENNTLRDIDNYYCYGTMPYVLKQENKQIIYDQVIKTIDEIISKDIPKIGKFTPDVVAKIPEILYLLSTSDSISIRKISERVSISTQVISTLLDTIEKADLIVKLYPYGSHFKQIGSTLKYLFRTPIFRNAYNNQLSSSNEYNNYKGLMLEDTGVLYLNKFCQNVTGASLTFISDKSESDYILKIGGEAICFEFGYGRKDFSQILSTLENKSCKYGIVVSSSELKLETTQKNSINVPITYFLLL